MKWFPQRHVGTRRIVGTLPCLLQVSVLPPTPFRLRPPLSSPQVVLAANFQLVQCVVCYFSPLEWGDRGE